jgi:hypothetical protein
MSAPQLPPASESAPRRLRWPTVPQLRIRPARDMGRIVLLWVAWLAIICTFQIVA